MRFWHGMGYTPLEELTPLAQRAEALGFFGITLGDHWVTAEKQADRYDIAEDGVTPWQDSAPWPDIWIQFTALSKDTTRLHFMSTVYILPLRDAFTAAKAIGTASVLTHGRIHVGLGVGWQKLEFELSGQPFDKRGRHVDEQIEVLEKLWTGEMVEHSGEFYSFPRVRMLPAPTSPIPILVGGTSDAAFRRAARQDGWEGAVYPWNEIESYLKGARAARLEAKGDLDGFRLMVGCTEPTPDRMEQLREWGVTDYLKPPWTDGLLATERSLQFKLDEMAEFAATYGLSAQALD
ncbi:MAG: LLM class F420-dependent oxidoreductase [Deltaproteobacteria bacterium]|nr:LLM class F420-dependent oxidoreductase [Deltaproteobacteria bacterium]